MQSSSFRLISAVVTLLLFLGMIGVVVLVMRTAPAVSMAPSALLPSATTVTPQADREQPAAMALVTPTAELAQTHPSATTTISVTAGGFRFAPLADYTLERTASAATLTSQSGAIFLLRGGTPAQLSSAQTDELDAIFEQFVTFYANRDNFQSRNQRAVQIDGVAGLAVDLVSASTTNGFAGRIVMVQPASSQLFLLVAVSPAMEWSGAAGVAFQQLVQSIHFFPLATALAPNPTPPVLTRRSSPVPTASATLSGANIAAILRASPTPQPTVKATGLVTPTATVAAPSLTTLQPGNPNWRVYSNGNVVNDLVVANTMIWAATDGGVGAWNRSNNEYAKFTTLDGLAVNRTTTVVDCPLPGFGLVFGSDQGLQIFDTQRNRWKTLNSTNSEMHFDDISALYCSPEHGFLVVGYARHGIDIYDVKAGWTLLDQRRGLLDNAVQALMVMGDREEIWVASASGIAVVTESGVMVYDKSNTPLESSPTVMAGMAKGSIWLAAGNKVYRIDGKTWTIYSATYVLASAFPEGVITTLTLVDDGTLWIGSDQGDLCLFDPTIVTCKTFFDAKALKVSSGITKTALDPVGRLYVATAGDGVLLYDDKGWHPYRAPEELIVSNHVRAFAQDTLGFLWLATDTGLYQMETAADRIVQRFTSANTTFPVAEITTLYAAPGGGLWVGGGKGAAYFDGVQWQHYTKADGLAADRVQAIAGDAQKRIWFGTSEGLSIWNGQSFFTLTRADRLPSNNILTLLADDAAMWIGSDAGLLHFEDNRFQVYTTATTELVSNRITALAKERDGAILVGTDQGLARWADKTIRTLPETEDYPVLAIGLSAPNRIWLGTDGQGVLYFDGSQWTPLPDATAPPDQQVGAIAVDGQGSVWIAGVQGGVLRYVP